jgi:HD-GYP domain-containing protein (c-di-GMP phosphodiesterase class II)
MGSRNKKYEKMIQEGIVRAYYKNIFEEEKQLTYDAKNYPDTVRKQAKQIIDHINKAQNEIYVIENSEKKAINYINGDINLKIQDIAMISNRMLVNKENRVDELKKIVSDLIDDTGPKRDATFLLLNVKRAGFKYLLRHSINVCLLSIAVAIEMSKMMTDKIQEGSLIGDFKKLQICNDKIFNKEELINLGVSAILHDMVIFEHIPDLDENTAISVKDQSKVELHPNNGYHFLTNLEVDFDIRKAVLQHHENIDGSGYPSGIRANQFNKYSLILSFANQIEQMTTKNPFIKFTHPHSAIMFLLKNQRGKYDEDVILAYCKACSIYPLGSWVKLSNNKIGIVFKTTDNIYKPIIKCVYSDDYQKLIHSEFIDLSKTEIKVIELISIQKLESVDKEFERFIFDERQYSRIKTDISARFTIPASAIKYDVKNLNISAGGTLMELNADLKLGQEFKLDFQFKQKEFQNMTGLIIWKNEEKKHYGVRFLSMEDESYQSLLRFTDDSYY